MDGLNFIYDYYDITWEFELFLFIATVIVTISLFQLILKFISGKYRNKLLIFIVSAIISIFLSLIIYNNLPKFFPQLKSSHYYVVTIRKDLDQIEFNKNYEIIYEYKGIYKIKAKEKSSQYIYKFIPPNKMMKDDVLP